MVVFHPEAMFPSHSPWNGGGGEHGDTSGGAVVTSDYQHAHAFEQYQDSITAVAGTPTQNLAAVAHVFKQPVSDDNVEYVPEAKRLAYAPSPFINKSPGSPYCENGSINSPMSVAAATTLDAYNHSLQQQQHHLDQSNYDQSSVPNSADLNVAAANQQLHAHMHHDFNPLSPYTQQASANATGPPGSAPGQTMTPISAAAAHASMLAQQSEMIQASSNAAVAAAHSNLNQLPSYPAMTGSPRNYLTPSPGGAADSAALAAASGAALNRYGGGPIYGPPQSSSQLTRPLSPVMICDLAGRQLGGPPPSFPSHYLPAGLPSAAAAANNAAAAAAAGHQMSSMHASQFPPQSPHALGPAGPLMRMGFPYRYPPSPYFDFRSGHPPSPYHAYQLSNGPNAPPFFRDEFIKPGRKPSSPASVFPTMQSSEVITLGDVCEMKEPDELGKIVLPNAEDLLNECSGMKEMATRVLEIESRLCFSLLNLRLSDPVMYIYNPLDYARQIHQTFVLKWGSKPKRVLFLGMNPGPFGMAQNGIPFGDGQFVKNFLKMEKGTVTKPSREHPKRPIWGLECPQREVSGSRFWSLVQSISGTPDAFFANCYVYNYCPLVFLGMSGKNITPPSLGSSAREPLLQACDKALVDIVNLMGIEKIVAVGRFVEERSKLVLKTANREDVEVIFIMHPSPINPKANAGWESIVKGQLEEAKIAHFFPHFYNPIPVTFSTTAATPNGQTTSSAATSSSSISGSTVTKAVMKESSCLMSTGSNDTSTALSSVVTTSNGGGPPTDNNRRTGGIKTEVSSCGASNDRTDIPPRQQSDSIVSDSRADKLTNHYNESSTNDLSLSSQGAPQTCVGEVVTNSGAAASEMTSSNAAPHLRSSPSVTKCPSLVGQLSIASEASTFADEFMKAEVTITSNPSTCSEKMLSNSSCNNLVNDNNNTVVKMEPSEGNGGHAATDSVTNSNERSAIDNLIASTQVQQQNLNFNSSVPVNVTVAGHNTSQDIKPSLNFPSQSNYHIAQQGQPNLNSNNTISTTSVSAAGLSSIDAANSMKGLHQHVAEQQQQQPQMMMHPNSNDSMLQQQQQQQQQLDSASFYNQKLKFQQQQQNHMQPGMGGSPYLAYSNNSPVSHMMPPTQNSPHGMNAHYASMAAAANYQGYATTTELYHSSSPGASAMYPNHLHPQHYAGAPDFSHLHLPGVANHQQQQFNHLSNSTNPATGLPTRSPGAAGSMDASGAGNHQMGFHHGAGGATPDHPNSAANSYYAQQLNHTSANAAAAAAQYDCYPAAPNILSG